MDWLKESEPLPTRRTTRSTSPPQSQTSSRVINLDANISSRLALQSHDLSADTVVVTRSTSTRSALDTHNTSFVRTGGHDSTNIGGSLPRYYSDENSVTLTRPQRNRFFNWISSKMGHGKRIKTKNRPASLRTAFLGELFILVINDEEGFEELKRFSVKDFSVDNPIFYGEWRKLMASVLMSTGSLSEEVFILVDNMKSIRRLLENSTDDQIQRLGVFGWVRLQPDQGGRSGVSETVSMSSEEYGTSGPSISELVGLRPSRSQQFQTSTAASNIPSAYPPRKRRVPPNSIVNVFPDQPVPNELLGRFIQFYDIFIKPGHAPLEVGLPADISSDITLAIDAHRRMVRAKRENSRLAKRYLQSSTSALPISNMASAQLAAAQTQLLMSTVRAQIAQNVIDRVSILSDNPVISPVYPPPAPGTAQIGGDEQETKPLSVSVFDAAKDYILMSMFRETFPRFLGVPEGRRIVMDLMDKAERANPRMSRTGLRS
ncbi:hypothetical protein BJ742DRAFT_53843 [Cladochytrium replicatum]|nr:hypothetical protein BJ742DRAFT_53843 [Cladochytrium replicatum]